MISLIFSVVLLLFSLIYLIGINNERYWRKRGAACLKKNMVFLFWDYVMGDRSLSEVFGDVYFAYPDAPAVGAASLMTPSLFIRDPKNIQHVLAENFNAFHHRGLEFNKQDKLANNVTFLNGPEWKLIRQKMSPLFTSSKLKSMQNNMEKSAEDFVDYLNSNLDKANTNAFETTSLFCCAAITAAVFGFGTGSTFESPFMGLATKALIPSWRLSAKFVLLNLFPKLCNTLGMKFFSEQEDEFINAIKYVLREREKVENSNAHDFAELVVNIQKDGIMKDSSTGFQMVPTDELMAAQGFFFLIAGVEPSATGLFFTLYELARHPDMLKRVQDEIDSAYKENKGKITFEVIAGLKYLDMCLEEGLRMYPPIGVLTRKCTENSVLPVGNIKVDKGTLITIPTFSIHHDPEYYPNPNVFDPERFSPDVKKRPNMTYMPFGEGNRICIGSRFAYLQIKIGIIRVLRNFDVKTKDSVHKVVRFVRTPVAIRPTKDTNFHFSRRKNIPS